ncbi:MAG: HDOD domain-containing protein [Desulfobacterales bacterium]
MKVNCPECQKVFEIPGEHLKKYDKQIAFPCPACQKGRIKIELDSASKQPSSGQPLKLRTNKTPVTPSKNSKQPISGMALKRRVLQRVEDLPPMPQIVLRAREIMADQTAGISNLVNLLQNDQSIVTKVLRLSNSACYGLSGKISTVQHAAVLLGQKTLSEVITMAGVSDLMGKELPGYGMDAGDLWRHSLAVGFGAQYLAERLKPQLSDDAFVAGLIHDGGKIILDEYVLQRKAEFETFLADGEQTYLEAEKDLLGVDHSEIAADICKKWILPEAIHHPIRWHHRPSRSGGSELALFLHVADYFAKMSGMGTGLDDLRYQVEESAIESLGYQEAELDSLLVDVMESVDKIAQDFQDI